MWEELAGHRGSEIKVAREGCRHKRGGFVRSEARAALAGRLAEIFFRGGWAVARSMGKGGVAAAGASGVGPLSGT